MPTPVDGDVRRGAPAAAPTEEYELWVNNSEGPVVLKKYSVGGKAISVRVPGGGRVHITPHERQINQEIAYRPVQDMFTNGTLSPVRPVKLLNPLNPEEEATSPNLLTETEMSELLKAKVTDFNSKLAEITNPILINKLLELARADGGVTAKRVELIEARREVLSPTRPPVHEGGRDPMKKATPVS